MSLFLVSNDLMTGSKVSAVAARLGLAYASAMNVAAAVEKLSEGTSIVAIDLSMPGLKSPELVPKLRTKLKVRPRIIAFGPHVYGELLEEAETSGCDVVVSRGEFFAKMMELLSPPASLGEQEYEGEASG
jgi:CheY-like chemotaxis protein